MPEEQKPRTLWVKSADPEKVGVWDRHPDQPDGEVFVAGERVVRVAATPVVLDALSKRMIVEVSGPGGKEKAESDLPEAASGKPAQPAVGGEAPQDAARGKR